MGSRHVPARTVLFEKEKNGVTYRVPALLYLPRWRTLLAFAEERLSADDAHANLIVLRRGIFYRNYVEWEDMHAVEQASLPGHRSMNPCPVYDDATGQLFLFFIAVFGRTTESYQIITGQNAARLCYVRSLDQGKSWSEVTDLTHQVIGESLKGEWATFALGPGHGIQLRNGRLIIPAYTYHIEQRHCFGSFCQTTARAFAFHSDDHGQSWNFGDLIPNLHSVECQMVSVDEADGNNILYCNARSSLGFRVQALSTDDGVVFEPGQLIEKLVETPTGCHGSVIGFPAPLHTLYSPCPDHHLTMQLKCQKAHNDVSGKNDQQKIKDEAKHINQFSRKMLQWKWKTEDHRGMKETFYKNMPDVRNPTWVLYSHPTSARSRVNLGVYLTSYPRDADSWTGPWVIYEGPSAYSDLAYLGPPSGEKSAMGSLPVVVFACLYENGLSSPYEQISFSIFTLYEVIQNLTPSSEVMRQTKMKHRIKKNCTTS
ncbi:sialidase-4 [Xenopus tropicalis]|uniref:exo-alpha-sialidase n=1 Tax=Xenopus tropicalis TaxID=8364 RepID=K0PUT3_XENTR|nr:sialidase-4 [Xenopus tropicalis]DAA35246.1 TPA_inf: sialidase NEU4 [Xenopus tropicalis]|eukprot:NP_001265675.1 sialidase-4 [Xenopus tropicalis]